MNAKHRETWLQRRAKRVRQERGKSDKSEQQSVLQRVANELSPKKR